MTRNECEDKLLALADEMEKVFLEYAPEGESLNVAIHTNGFTHITAPKYDEDGEMMLLEGNKFDDARWLYVTRRRDINVMRTDEWSKVMDGVND